jgi:enoyl-CoA hydratase/carnithine racemase
MPTVALINGHAFAGGLMMAMHHDYRVMSPARGFVCLNELEFGAALKPAMSGIFRLKTPPATYRSLVLEAHRFGGAQAKEAGLVDVTGGMDEALALIKERNLIKKAMPGGIYGVLKAEMYRESIGYLTVEGHEREEARDQRNAEAEDRRKVEGEKRVAELKRAQKPSKL